MKDSRAGQRRKGYVRRADIPEDVLRALNEGREETVTLAEWLAIDMRTLLVSVAREIELGADRQSLGQAAERLADLGVMKRLKGIGEALFETSRDRPSRGEVHDAVATHGSDMVRAWGAYMLTADESLSLSDRLLATRRFAADRAMAVRECAWESFRQYVATDLDHGLRLLEPWVVDIDENIRRCAVEGTRPRGVWTPHIAELKENPELGLRLLEPVRSDPSRYVQRSVGNWLNDAGKTRPEWLQTLCERWLRESPTAETAWTVNHALRSIRKQMSSG